MLAIQRNYCVQVITTLYCAMKYSTAVKLLVTLAL